MNESKYYYSIMWHLDQVPREEARIKLKMLQDSLGKRRVSSQLYHLKKTKRRVIMSVEEIIIYQKILELKNPFSILTDYKEDKPNRVFDKFGYDKY